MKSNVFRIIALFIFCSHCLNLYGKNDTKIARNAVFIEIGGTAGYYSLKYNRIFFKKDILSISGGIGFAPTLEPWQKKEFDWNNNNEYKYTWELSPRIPLSISLLIGKRKHFLETGLSYSPYFWAEDVFLGNAFFPEVGYRYQKIKGGFFFRASFTPLLYDSAIGFDPMPWGGIGLGTSF